MQLLDERTRTRTCAQRHTEFSGRAIYGPQFNPQITLKALSYFGEGSLQRLPETVKDRLAAAARAVDLDRLPAIVPAAPPATASIGPRP